MLDEVELKADDVNVETGLEYRSMEELVQDAKALGCDAVLNCTGMGAASLCKDKHLIGARGILHHYDRKTCVVRQELTDGPHGPMLHDAVILTEDPPWASDGYPAYLIPRRDILVVGGSYLEGDTETKIRPMEHQRLVYNADRLGIDTEQSKPIGEWTGFRPYRRLSRCEVDSQYGKEENIKVVHSYGYGGSGWTVYVGAAMEATRLLLASG